MSLLRAPVRAYAVGGLILVATVFRLWLGSQQSLQIIDAKYDDMLLFELAEWILKGQWLGPYNQYTLAKGPFYPLWIALNSVLGIPLHLSHHLLYVVACALFALAVRPFFASVFPIAGIYLLLLFNPVSFAESVMTRMYRHGVAQSLTLGTLACAIGMVSHRSSSPTVRVSWACALGIFFSAFWLNREEGLWLVPALIVVYGASVILSFRVPSASRWQPLKISLLPLLIAGLVMTTVGTINSIYYKTFVTVEFTARPFRMAYGSLRRIESDQPRARVPIPRDVREKAYAVSPTYATLRDLQEGPMGRADIATSCRKEKICDDIAAAWFAWSFRDSLAAAGYFHRGAGAVRGFYRRMTAEIDEACEDGRLRCGPLHATLAPHWRSRDIPAWTETFLSAMRSLPAFTGVVPNASPSKGSPEYLGRVLQITKARIAPTPDPEIAKSASEQWALGAISSIIVAYQRVGAVVFYGGLIAALVFLAISVATLTGVGESLCLAGLMGAVLTRVALLSYIHVTSFRAIRIEYMACAYSLWLAFAAFAFLKAVESVAKLRIPRFQATEEVAT